MHSRCNRETDPHYTNYGGRGVKVCERWGSFENFLADMGERPEGRTLDRIDVNGHYEPANCRWSTPSEQAKGRRRRVPLDKADVERIREMISEGLSHKAIAAHYRVCTTTIHSIRHGKNGW